MADENDRLKLDNERIKCVKCDNNFNKKTVKKHIKDNIID